MTHKVIGFYPSTNDKLKTFVEQQISAVAIAFPTFDCECVDESDYRLTKFSNHPDRFPCYLLLQNDARKNIIHAKMNLSRLLEWVSVSSGVTY